MTSCLRIAVPLLPSVLALLNSTGLAAISSRVNALNLAPLKDQNLADGCGCSLDVSQPGSPKGSIMVAKLDEMEIWLSLGAEDATVRPGREESAAIESKKQLWLLRPNECKRFATARP